MSGDDGHENRQQRRQRERQERKANTRKPHRLEDIRHVRPDDDICMQPGWCETEDDLPEARKQTHDTLIRSLGPRRRSGVGWVQETGERAFELVDHLADGETAEVVLAYCAELRARLNESGGWIVVAYAKADKPQ